MSLDRSPASGRRLGVRYRIEETDGSWWELGWDRPLGTFYAQHYRLDPEGHEHVITDLGNGLSEIPTTAHLSQQIDKPIPAAVARELEADAAAFPFVVPPRVMAAPDMLVLTPDPDTGATSAAQLAAWEASLRRWEDRLTGWAQCLYAHEGIEPRWLLPAAPVADALRTLHAAADQEDVATFASGVGLDRRLVDDLLAGRLTELDINQIAQVCEGLHCSPYDLWGAELARTVLHAYGPEHWPRHSEPLDDIRPTSPADAFVERRLDAQAADQLRVTNPPTHHHPPAPATRAVALSATCYQRVALLASEPNGVTRVVSAASDASPDADYHFAFRQITEPRPVTAPEDTEPADSPSPIGWDVDPRLAAVADRFRAQPWLPAVDLIRFVHPDGTETWLGWDPTSEAWEEWDDPRRNYPGSPADVLDPAGHTDPTPTTHVHAITNGDVSGIRGPVEFDERTDLGYGITDDRTALDDDAYRLHESGPDLGI
jgi:hypothetical protein